MIEYDLIARWPGKSAGENGVEHPAIYHMLDVASVAEAILEQTAFSSEHKQALVILAALHDIGKLHSRFRCMLRGSSTPSVSHWRLSEVYLFENIELLAKILNPDSPSRLDPLIDATAGHHGRPSDWSAQEKRRAKRNIPDDVQLMIKAIAELWPGASLAGIDEQRSYELSWWFSGLVTTADWIGSNANWFEAAEPVYSLGGYLNVARVKAAAAIKGVGIESNPASRLCVFDWPELRPMQEASRSVALANGPMLAIIEDETGSGKTEAALMLAQRMLTARKGQGLFFALPTMATADAMFSRVSKLVGKMFVHKPTVTLAHGRAGLSEDYRDIQEGQPNAPEDIGCTEWLGDSRRRALLATVGVGTIDQALLSTLPVKFQTLRHFGLASKILIVDEVHELGEPYIAETLTALLKLHRVAGGSAILLTATLPIELRSKLLATYGGADDKDQAYPALTIGGGAAVRDMPQNTGPKGPVSVERLASAEHAVLLIKEKAATGAACVWVRNAVDDAIAAFEALRAEGVEAELLHARYTLGDRKRIERLMRDRFGKNGKGREGCVLVGTQVLESSLDLDFDVMVSDLAPMAGLVQRVGRLWRHMDIRPADNRPVTAPVLYVVSPDPLAVEHGRWLMDVLDSGAYTYSADLMWRTAYHLFRQAEIVAPSGIRPLIESAYSGNPETPEVLDKFERDRKGKEFSHQSLASMNIVRIEDGYGLGGQAHDDASYPTRLGPEQRTLVLARERDGRLVPYIDGPDGWAMSEVSAAKHRLEKLELPDQSSPRITAITDIWKEWMRGKYTLCPVAEDGSICEELSYQSDKGLIF
ncbi:CRISPR-associated helicase Cas3' [Yoonia sediminilitoris]|uniref:CRISPR-associated Cas3 family helicase n=1 Tax=Yoonia sediminilitoris TaxID=1286148 RepID=A0A2T6K770_9RHOB|nr:CRISPR-associated helicase Cas3' [Yoonia sediminilitoris]PUB10534.1 CRISPR-associated Cas3 family helicase [Yoonia sediminilitoris]RCW90086.1 CRISPR-associated Cas3 family helicase [Yoonia sediminilitoris]